MAHFIHTFVSMVVMRRGQMLLRGEHLWERNTQTICQLEESWVGYKESIGGLVGGGLFEGKVFSLYSSADAMRTELSWRAANPGQSMRASSPLMTLCISVWLDTPSSKLQGAVKVSQHTTCEVMHSCRSSKPPLPPLSYCFHLRVRVLSLH